MGDRRRAIDRQGRRVHAQGAADRRARARARSASSPPRIKEIADARVGDTITDDRKPAAEPLPGFSPSQPVVFCGMYPTDADDYEQSARQPGQAPPQRCQLRLRAGEQRGPGPRLPLRLPGPAASRDHPGAAGARVRPRPRHHRTLGRLPGPPDRRRRCWSCTTRPTIPIRRRIDHVEEPWIKATILVPDEYLGGDPAALPGEARRAAGAHLCRQPRHGGLSPAA